MRPVAGGAKRVRSRAGAVSGGPVEGAVLCVHWPGALGQPPPPDPGTRTDGPAGCSLTLAWGLRCVGANRRCGFPVLSEKPIPGPTPAARGGRNV